VHDTGTINPNALLTIRQLEMFFDGVVSYQAIDQWVRRGKLTPAGKNNQGQVLIRFGDAQAVEAATYGAKRGRPRKMRPAELFADHYL
jgi:hypothetical protein